MTIAEIDVYIILLIYLRTGGTKTTILGIKRLGEVEYRFY